MVVDPQPSQDAAAAARAQFVGAELSCRRAGAAAVRIRWSHPEQVELRLDLPAPAAARDARFAPAAAEAERAQQALRSLAARPGADSDDCVLHLRRPAAEPATLRWSAAQEAPELAAAREALEALAHARYVEASAIHEMGRAAGAAGDAAAAIGAFKQAITILGSRYYSAGLRDDTGMRVLLSEQKERDGEPAAAAALLGSVLEARLSEYRRSHGLQD